MDILRPSGFVTEGIHSNTLAAYMLAAKKGADMIETDERTTRDGVIIVNHDPSVKGFDENGERWSMSYQRRITQI